MKKAATYEKVIKRFYRPEIYKCPECGKSLKRAITVSERTVVTLGGVIQLIHGGYRCINPECEAKGRTTYRSAAADALALPRMKFGIDIVILVGRLRLGGHKTLDETHEELCKRLEPLGASVSRREVMYLFDAFSTLLGAASDAALDKEWRVLAERNKGIIVSIDGIKPDSGNETIYLVRDALTGRLLNAENVRENSVESLKQVLAPIIELNMPVLGTLSDAQESEVLALSQLWPDVPHQTCQFHALQEASRSGFQEDGKILAQMKKEMMPKVRAVREQIGKKIGQISEEQTNQLEILDTYALCIQTAITRKGKLPFDYACIEASEALDDIATSLDQLEKGGGI